MHIVLIAIAVAILIFVIIVALQPAEYRIWREATISASPAELFGRVNNLHNWDAWSPWAKLDPAARKTYEGSPAGIGAIYTWAGNKKIGEGRMTISDSRPTDLVRIDLQFLKPFQSTSVAEFTFKPQGNQTLVTWSMTGRNGFAAKVFFTFMSMDKMIGGDFEKGLGQLKALAEGTK